MDKAERAASGGAVKQHVFLPSGRTVWTVVGVSREYWVDPAAGFCSCRSFYFAGGTSKGACYHLDSVGLARRAGTVERVEFPDDEYEGFVLGVIEGFE